MDFDADHVFKVVSDRLPKAGIDFPDISGVREPKLDKMNLREYARFSERCLKSNSRITPENCMEERADEAEIEKPFSLEDE